MNWISVKDSVPDVYDTVLLWGIAIGDDLCESCSSSQENSPNICEVYLGYLDEDWLFRCDFKLDRIRVTHWMPLPVGPSNISLHSGKGTIDLPKGAV